jgi:UDP-N-acetylmuramoylalanine--D-glutamate ligase
MKYLLLGMGISNQSIEKYFQNNNYDYEVYDDNTNKKNIDLDKIDIIIKSPGINNNHFLLNQGKRVISDLELFYLLSKDKTLITVTGSNGKTTTVTLLKHLIQDIDLGGNVGIPFFDFIDSKQDIIIEASSFMLEYTHEFRSKFNIILNLYKTHLEHHITFNNYIKSKLKILKNCQDDDYIIYNYDDIILRKLVKNYRGIKIPFSRTVPVGIHLFDDKIIYNETEIENIKNIRLMGGHNYDNVMASLAVVLHHRGDIHKVSTFRGVMFRLEYITSINHIDVYNDSKSTNFNAMYNALTSFPRRNVLLICGGQKRNDTFNSFEDLDNIKKVYTFGENHNELAELFRNKTAEVYSYTNLEEVVMNLNLSNIDIILFSPGCVSYDQYSSYIDRGKHFNNLLDKYY